jgi:hypothetical protein
MTRFTNLSRGVPPPPEDPPGPPWDVAMVDHQVAMGQPPPIEAGGHVQTEEERQQELARPHRREQATPNWPRPRTVKKPAVDPELKQWLEEHFPEHAEAVITESRKRETQSD